MMTFKFMYEITIFTIINSFYIILLILSIKSKIFSFSKPIAIQVNSNNN